MGWTLPGPENNGNNIANAPIIAQVVANGGQWFLPQQELGLTVPETMSPGFDILGRDLPLLQLGAADFCVNVRLTWLHLTPGLLPGGDLIRADVRVLWPIGIVNALPGFCNKDTAALPDPNFDPNVVNPAGGDTNAPVFHTLYLTTTIRENTGP